MPEGDTIFRSARALGRALGGKVITGFRSAYPLLTRFHDDTPLTGQTVDRVEPRGKWLLMHFSGGATLATHMLMSGSWHIYRPGERWQKPRSSARIIIENAEYHAVGFNVPVAEMHTAESLQRDPRFPQQVNDLLSGGFLLIVIDTPVRKYLYVRWNLLWRLFFGYDGREASSPKEAAEPRQEPALEQV